MSELSYHEILKRRIRMVAKKRKLTFEQFTQSHFRIGRVLDYWPETGAYWVPTTNNDRRGECRNINELIDALMLMFELPETSFSAPAMPGQKRN